MKKKDEFTERDCDDIFVLPCRHPYSSTTQVMEPNLVFVAVKSIVRCTFPMSSLVSTNQTPARVTPCHCRHGRTNCVFVLPPPRKLRFWHLYMECTTTYLLYISPSDPISPIIRRSNRCIGSFHHNDVRLEWLAHCCHFLIFGLVKKPSRAQVTMPLINIRVLLFVPAARHYEYHTHLLHHDIKTTTHQDINHAISSFLRQDKSFQTPSSFTEQYHITVRCSRQTSLDEISWQRQHKFP